MGWDHTGAGDRLRLWASPSVRTSMGMKKFLAISILASSGESRPGTDPSFVPASLFPMTLGRCV